MRCQQCGFENPAGFKFCGECGAKLKIICQNCGFESPPNFKFCGECGTRLLTSEFSREESKKEERIKDYLTSKTEAKQVESKDFQLSHRAAEQGEGDDEREEVKKDGREAERRPISVLFADISGFTKLSEKLDPEELRAFIGDVLNKLAEIVRRNGGYVDKFIGDEVMALFGAPQAMGDDTKRAVKTAYEMLNFIRENYKDISLHGGIATGDVVVGSISDRPQDYTAMGDTVNIAKRLEEESASWQFLVDENTYIITSGSFEYKYFGSIKLKGKTKELKVYELVGKKKASKFFIGRDKEFQEISNILSSGNAFVGVYGEPGVGISSFIDFLQSNLQNSYKFVASDHGFFGTIKDIISSVYDLSDGKENTVYKLSQMYNVSPHFLGYVFGVVFPQSPLRYLPPEQIEYETFNTLSELMNKMFSNKIIIIDSFSEADRYTKKFFLGIPERSPNFSVIIGFDKGTIDPEQISQKWKLIELSNFNIDETQRFIYYLSGESLIPDDELVMTIFRITGGNPLFISELYELLKASDYFQVSDGILKMKSGVDIPKAIGIRQVILSKIDKLPQNARAILDVMSCMNTQSKEVLYKFFEDDLRNFSKGIDILKQNALVEEQEKFFNFKQVIYKDVIYDRLLKSRRHEIHSKLFECASEIAKDDIDLIYIAAEQAEKSERFTDAFEMYRKAGKLAKSKINFSQAIYFFENAYRVMNDIKDLGSVEDLYEFFIEFGEILYHVGDFQRAKNCFTMAEKFANTKRQVISARRLRGDCMQMLGEFNEAEKIYRDIISQAEKDISLKTELVRTLALLCHLFVDKGEPTKGVEFGLKALEVCDENFKEKQKEICSDVINALGRAYLSIGDVHKAKKFFMEFYELALKIDNQRIRGVAMSNYAVSLYSLGELESALLFFKQYLELSRSIMDTRGTAIALINISQVLFETGKVIEAQQKAYEALEIFRAIKDKYGTTETLEIIANMKVMTGQYDEAIEIVENELISGTESDVKKSKYNLFIAMALVGKNMIDEAESYLEKAKQLIPDMVNDVYYNIALSQIQVRRGNFELAYRLSKDCISKSKRDSERIFSILNFMKVMSLYPTDSVVFQDEKENYERELKNILRKFPDFSVDSFKFLV